MSSIHLDILDDKRKEAFLKLKSLKKNGYLAGGTALAMQINHRYSFDFDIFLNREIKRSDYLAIKRRFLIKKISLNTAEQLDVIINNDIKITLLYYYFKPSFPLIETSSLPLLSAKDIATDKAHTIGRRGRWRDYVDIFFLLKDKHLSMEQIIKFAEKKFKEEFNAKQFLEQLVYFKDLDRFDISFIGKKYTETQIKSFLESQVISYQKSIIKELRTN